MFPPLPKKIAKKFSRIFGVNYTKYWNRIYGLDIVAFDDDIVKSGDRQMKETLEKEWGVEGCQVILDIMAWERNQLP